MADDGAIVINFGILCGREATQAEIDRLAQALNDQAGAGPDITIVASRRQDYGHGIETVTHQVTVEATGVLSALPETVCRSWVERCADRASRRVARPRPLTSTKKHRVGVPRECQGRLTYRRSGLPVGRLSRLS